MTPLELAKKYMAIWFSGKSLDDLYWLLSDQCVFQGPFCRFNSAKAYIETLKADPPENVGYTIMKSYENEDSACLIYQFFKPGITTVMAQVFEVSHGKISGITLVFDSAAFL